MERNNLTEISTQKENLLSKIITNIENSVIVVTLFFIVLFPLLDLIGRKTGITSIGNNQVYINHTMIWLTMFGAILASREKNHISLAVISNVIPQKIKPYTDFFVSTVTVTVLFVLSFASLDYFLMVSEGEKVGVLPQLFFTIMFPIGFFWIAIRESKQKKVYLSIISIIIALLVSIFLFGTPSVLIEKISSSFTPPLKLFQFLYIPLFIGLFLATALGSPVFITLSGTALLLFYNSEQMIGYIPNEAYEVLTDDIFPTIPLFTLAGFILSEGKSGERLVAFFRALFGWLPGGFAIMAVLVSAFFTTFTGASGVTILALGGLLYYILTKEGYSEKFTVGFLTSSGSIGLLFAPSLPIILYGVQARINIKHLFAGAFIPGLFMILALSAYAIYIQRKSGNEHKEKFDINTLRISFKSAFLEILLPFIIVILYFTGEATLIQTGVVAVIYMLVVNMIIHKDFDLKELPQILLKAAPIVGAVLIILAAAKGLSYYIIDAQIPTKLTAIVREHLDPSNPSSKYIFLLLLNIALLITGFFMDIFSAIIVVVPLILPLSKLFGVDPVHLGVIFLANLELGYLTPPVGLNLFLSALRFEKPLVEVYKSVIPFLIIMLFTVIVITYVPGLTELGSKLFGYTH